MLENNKTRWSLREREWDLLHYPLLYNPSAVTLSSQRYAGVIHLLIPIAFSCVAFGFFQEMNLQCRILVMGKNMKKKSLNYHQYIIIFIKNTPEGRRVASRQKNAYPRAVGVFWFVAWCSEWKFFSTYMLHLLTTHKPLIRPFLPSTIFQIMWRVW